MAPYSFRFQLEVLLFWACVFLFSGGFSWQKQRGFWQTTLIFFVSVWLALIIPQAYKVTVKIKSESSEADVDTSLFKSWAAEGLSSPWAMIHCPNEHPKFHVACWAGTLDSIREKKFALLCVVRTPYFLLQRKRGLQGERVFQKTWAPVSSLALGFILLPVLHKLSCNLCLHVYLYIIVFNFLLKYNFKVKCVKCPAWWNFTNVYSKSAPCIWQHGTFSPSQKVPLCPFPINNPSR